ncbi:SDR family NAD(P)-dependent oxidoreductase [Halosegnis rubeus]|uniref:SDR family NAD(P)-dependent oxidoreductase n=1 Tax=Halosegnis rubeus TaxID=2212850 RepID=A0A5N5ULQ5_9EURY|nr:SDR family NAD(P)-dependent oxidoreductase [Halosegnis rubeus]KAB7519455.1 SDR family NAD(P)-dependent oxidoreductase [Halosegnis rubeus]
MIAESNVMVTGGAGSVGQMLVKRLLDADANIVRILDNNEPNLSELRSQLDDDRCRFLAGDVREKERLDRAMQGIDYVIHAAAMKHVDISEYNPFEAIKTNVMGLQNVVDAAIDSSVERLVFTSSDKAVNPANTMGTTKLLGEKLVTAGNKYAGRSDLRLASVRFGNVIGSSQSVVPLFRRQIVKGGPVTLTDDRMTRFFLTTNEMANLVLGALRHTKGGEVFLHDMAAMRITDLAKVMIEELAPAYGHDSDEINVEIVGRRIGETLHEEVVTEREALRTLEKDSLYAVPPETAEGNGYLKYDGIEGFEPTAEFVRSSADANYLDRSEITALLDRAGALEVPA